MRKFVFAVFVSFLLVALAFVQKGNIPPAKAAPSIYQGDLILTGNNVTTIEGRFDINGSIIVKDNATLVLKDAFLNFTQSEPFQHNITLADSLDGNPRLLTYNSTITGSHLYATPTQIWLCDNSTATISNSTIPNFLTLYARDNSNVLITSSSKVELLRAYHSSTVSICNSTIGKSWSGWSSVLLINDSTINRLVVHDSSNTWLLNSTCLSELYIESEAKVYFSWHLDVHVIDSIGQDVPVANVTVFSWHLNGHRSVSKSTNSDGLTRFTLIEKMLNATGEYPVHLTYVIATYEISTHELAGEAFWVNITGSGGLSFMHFGKLNMTDIDETISREQLDKIREDPMNYYVRLSKAAMEPPDVEILLPNGTSKQIDVVGNGLWTIARPYVIGGEYGTAAYMSMRDIILSYYDIFGQDIVYCIIKVRYRDAAMDEEMWLDITENKQVTLILGDFIIPEFPSLLTLPLFMITTLLAVTVYRKRRHELTKFQRLHRS